MTKNKHDHTATKKIKAWLFAIMLLLPFLFLLPTGLYYGLNQNAQLSERTEQTPVYYQTNEVTTYTDMTLGNQYSWNDNYNGSIQPDVYKYLFVIEKTDNLSFLENWENITKLIFRLAPSGNLTLYIESNLPATTYNLNGKPIEFVIKEYAGDFSYTENLITYFSESSTLMISEYVDITYNNDISTSIINAWNSTWQNPLFSWTNYSPFYAPMQSFTNVFGINNMQIANVLTYLATITAIYIVFDIVIELFTYLTHLIPRSD